MIQYNIIQDQTEKIFLYCIIVAIDPTQPTDLQLTRAGTNAFKFHFVISLLNSATCGLQREHIFCKTVNISMVV